MTNIWKRSLSMFMAIVMVFSLLPMNVFAEGTDEPTPCEHTNQTTTTVNATCNKDGSVTVTCNDCGETVSTETISATGEHTPGAEATCGAAQTCTVCGIELAPATGVHTPGAEATCGAAQACTVCGKVLNAALGHDFGEDNKAEKCSVCEAENPDVDVTEPTDATEAEVDEEVVRVQALINALRTTINEGEEAEAEAEYNAVTAAITALTDEQRAQLDLTNYYAAAIPTVIPEEADNVLVSEDELKTALAAGGEFVLGGDIVVSTMIEIPADVTVTLDLAGYDIIGGQSGTKHIYVLSNKGTLTVNDSVGDGKIVSRGVYNYGSLTLNGGTIEACDGDGGYAVNNESGSTFVMNGGAVVTTYDDDPTTFETSDATAIDVCEGNTTTINGGTVSCVSNWCYAISSYGTLNITNTKGNVKVSGVHGAVSVNGGTTAIDGGEFVCVGATNASSDHVLYASGAGSLTVNDGTFTNNNIDAGSNGAAVCLEGSDASATINKGTFTGCEAAVYGNANTVVNGGSYTLHWKDTHNTEDTLAQYVATNATVSVDSTEMTKTESGLVDVASIVAKIGDDVYTTFAEALTAASAMTGDVVVDVYGEVEFTDGMELKGSYTSITFNGKADGAKITINQTAGGDYLEAHGKTVAFNNLILAKANPAWSGNSGHMGNYFSIQGGTVTYTNCTFPNGACTSGGTATYTGCTFLNASEYGLWVYDDALVTVNGGTIDSKKGIKVYSEDEASVTSTLTVQNATFTENVTAKPAVAIGYAESITLIGNTYNNPTANIELDSGSDADCEGITLEAKDAVGNDIASTLTVVDRSNSNAACGVLVDGKIYTTVAQAAEVATEGSTVTLLHESTETVELPMGVTLDKNDFDAAGVTVKQPPVAKVGDTEYTSIDEAIDAWTDGTTLTLLADVTLTDVIKLSSTEYHILDLGTYTMTAASGKDAIQYVVNGRSSASFALDIKADATNPGGITATGKTIVSHLKPSSNAPSKDRPITRFYGGIFNASYVVKQGATNNWGFLTSGYTGASAPYFQFYGGEFNGTIYTNRSQNQFHGGTFNGSMQMSVDSSAYTQVAGGTFKNLSNSMGSALNSDKFTIGSSKGANNGSVCIDENGYYVVTTTTPTAAEASVASNYNSSNYFYYSTVNTNGMYYEDVYDALEANTTGTVTVFTEELDLTDSSFAGTIVVPAESKLTITNAPATLVVKDTEGNVLEPNANGTYITIEPKGNDFTGYTREDAIWGETWGNANESFVIKVLDANGNVMGTTSLNNVDGIIDGDVNVTWSLKLDAASNTDEYWTMEWTNAPTLDNQPAKVELWVDGVKVSGGDVVLNAPDNLKKIVAVNADSTGKIKGYYASFQDAVNAAQNGDTIELVSGETVISMAGSVVGGKTVTITGTAIVDWTKGNLFIGRGGEGDGKVIFDGATITSSVKKTVSASTGIHVSGSKASDNTTNNGTLVIKNSNIEVDYLINRNEVTVEGNSTLTVYGGCWTHGRDASESASGNAETATLTIEDGATVDVINENGMGVGGEGNGIMTVKGTYKANVLNVSKNGTVKVDGGVLDIAGATTNNGELTIKNSNLTNATIAGSGTTYFSGDVNFYGTNEVLSVVNGSDFNLIVNEDATLLISRFVMGYNRNITVYGTIEDAHNFDPTGKTPSLKFNNTNGVSVGGYGTGDLTVENAYVELDSSSWKNATGTYNWTFENSYVSATSFTNNNARGDESATWNVTFDDSVLAAKNYIKNGVGTTYNFTNGSVATTGSLRIDGVMNIDETSSVTTTSQQNNKVGALDEHGGINGTVNVAGTLTIGATSKTQLEMLDGELNVEGGKVDLGNNTLTIDDTSKLTIDVTGLEAGEYTGIIGAVEKSENGTIAVEGSDDLHAYVEDGKIVLKTPVAQIGETRYWSLQDAVDAVSEGETIVLQRELTFTEGVNGSTNGISVTRGVSFNIDLNGMTVTSDLGGNALRFKIGDGNDVTNTDVTINVSNGKVVSGSNNWCAISAATADNSGNKLTLNLTDLEVENYKAGDYAIKSWAGAVINAKNVDVTSSYGGGFYAVGGEVVLDDCTATQSGLYASAPWNSAAFGVSGGGKMTINSGNYYATPNSAEEGNNQGTSHGSWVGIIMSSGGTLEINGGTFKNDNFGEDSLATYARALLEIDAYGELIINGGEFDALGSAVEMINNTQDGAAANPTAEINGGNFVVGGDTLFSGNPTGLLYVYGGTYSAPVAEEFCGEGLVPAQFAEGIYGVKDQYEAKIGKKSYVTLADAIAAYEEGDTIILQADVYVGSVIEIGKNVVIRDYSEYSIKTIADGAFHITGSNSLTLDEVIADIAVYADSTTAGVTVNGKAVTGTSEYKSTVTSDGTNVEVINPEWKVTRGNALYMSVAAAVAELKEGDTIIVKAGEYSEGTIKLPATLKNVTIKGEEGAVLKDTSISASDGNSYSYVGLTFDGLTFDNGRILLTGWRNGEETIENLTVTNCTFKNLYDTTNTAPVHINKDASEAVNGFTFTNNVIDGATGGSKSGVYAQVTGNVVFTNNVINNVSFRPYVIQITTDDGIADEFIVTGNTFSGSAAGRAQGLGNNAAGTDTVKLVVSENIFKDITSTYQICYWNFNEETTTADLSKNYYDIDIEANPDRIYYNSEAESIGDLIEKGIYPYYADEAKTTLVEAPIAAIGNVGYYDLHEALVAGKDGKTVQLLCDVDLTDVEWTPVDDFKGTFDGLNHTISNLVINGGSNSNIGLFGTTQNGEIKNLTINNAKVSGRLNVGVLAGTPYTSKYTNIKITGHVEVVGMSYVGGVGGKNAYANWTDITVDVDSSSYVKATSTENGTAYRTYVGGVVGFNGEGGHTFKNIYSNIKVIGDVCDIGGLFGIAHYGNKFENVTFAGSVEAPEGAFQVGGIAGVWHNQKGQTVTFDKVTSTGTVTVGSETTTGSIVGGAYNANNEGYDNSGSLKIDGEEAWLCAAKIGDTKYLTLQAAIDAAVDDDVIVLSGSCAEDVTVTQAPDVAITIDGADKTMTGTITVNGKSAAYATAGLTIKNVKFDATNISKDACINLGDKGNNNTRYTSNVTVEKCTFTDNDNTAAGIKNYTGGCKNLTVTDCTATDMHSLVQVKGVDGIKVEDVQINGKNGISVGTSTNVAIERATIAATGYGFRADGSAAYTATVKDSTISAEHPIVVRYNTGEGYKLTLDGANNLSATNDNGYAVTFTTGDDGTYYAPTVNVDLSDIKDVAVFPVGHAKIGNVRYTSLQKAIDAAKGGDIVTLLVDSAEDVTIVQKADLNLIIDGNDMVYSGTMTIHGQARYEGAETLTIQNFKFESSEAGHYFIDSNSTASAERYAHNVTVKESSFAATGAAVNSAAAMRIRQGFDIAIEKVTANGLHSVLQGYGIDGVAVNGLTATDMKNGISLGTSKNVVIEKATITATGYGIRADGSHASDATVKDSTITANLPIVVRNNTADGYKLTLQGTNTLTAGNENGYQVTFTTGDDGTYVEPSVTVEVSGAEGLKIFPEYRARINDVYYDKLSDAVDAAQEGDIIDLLKSVTKEQEVILADKEIKIRSNNNKAVIAALYGYTVLTTDEYYHVIPISSYTENQGPMVAYVVGAENKLLTLQQALDAAANSESKTVKLKANVEIPNSTVIIPSGVTLDIESYTVTAKNVIGLNGSFLRAQHESTVDGQMDGGKLVVAKNNLVLSEQAPMMTDSTADNGTKMHRYLIPIWSPSENCYRFARIYTDSVSSNDSVDSAHGLRMTDDEIIFKFTHRSNTDINRVLLNDGATDNAMSIVLRLEWDVYDASGNLSGTAHQDFVYSDYLVSKVAVDGWRYTFNLKNYSAMGINKDSLKVYANIVTDSGVTAFGHEWTNK